MEIRQTCLGVLSANCYIVNKEGDINCVIVDPGGDNSSLFSLIEDAGLKPGYIFLTHGHGDHTGGIDALKARYPEIKVVAGKKEEKLLYDRHMSKGKGGIVADVWAYDGMELEFGGITYRFIATPGHTKGGVCILAEGVLFSGDTLFQLSVGRTDFETGSYSELMDSIKNKLFALPDDTRVLPGHEGETTIGFEKRYNPFCTG